MALFLVEADLNKDSLTQEGFLEKTSTLQEKLLKQDVQLIEVQVTKDISKAYFIFEEAGQQGKGKLQASLLELGVAVTLIKPVRLVGEELEEVKKQAEQVNYLVEWNLPEHLTMEQYLERKMKNSVHYAEVPEVSFARTYVCEDMTKCLCFYDAPNEAAVKKAREAVKAPIDAITEIAPK